MTKQRPETTPAISMPSWRHTLTVILAGLTGMAFTLLYLLGHVKPVLPQQRTMVVHAYQMPGHATDYVVDRIPVYYHKKAIEKQDSLRAKLSTGKDSRSDIQRIDFKRLYFSYNPALFVWISLAALLTGFSLGLIPFLANSIIHTAKVFPAAKRTLYLMLLSTLALLLTASISTFMGNTEPPYVMKPFDLLAQFGILETNPYGLAVFTIPVLLAALAGLYGQLMINRAIDSLSVLTMNLEGAKLKNMAALFNLLRNRLQFFVSANAMLMVFMVFVTDAFRLAIQDEISTGFELIPQNTIFLYGLMFSFYIGIIYLPVFYRLKNKGMIINESLAAGIEAEQKKEMTALFLMKAPPLEAIKMLLSILGPVLVSLLPGITGK